MKILQSSDIVDSCLLFTLCLSVLPSTIALRTLEVLSVQLLQTSKLLEKRK
jgi:hypothetical protein